MNIKKAEPSNDYGVYRCNVEDDNGVVVGSAYTAVTVGYAEKTSRTIFIGINEIYTHTCERQE